MFIACCKMVLAALWTEGAVHTFPQLPQTRTHPPALVLLLVQNGLGFMHEMC